MKNQVTRPPFPMPEGFKTTRGGFGGKPMSHWQRDARKLVMDGLVRASMVDTRSIVGAMAAARLLEIAEAEDPEMLQEVLDERERCQINLGRVMQAFMLTSAEARARRLRPRSSS